MRGGVAPSRYANCQHESCCQTTKETGSQLFAKPKIFVPHSSGKLLSLVVFVILVVVVALGVAY